MTTEKLSEKQSNLSLQKQKDFEQTLSSLKQSDEATINELMRKLDDPDPEERCLAVSAMGKLAMGEIEAKTPTPRTFSETEISKLINALDNPNPFARSIVAATLGETGSQRAIAALSSLLKTETDEEVRYHISEALKKLENHHLSTVK